ncbi:MAG: S41 family peptidase [Pirellulales bacterium]|nr:S41 family peptidase [Pirellulales bacterium]
MTRAVASFAQTSLVDEPVTILPESAPSTSLGAVLEKGRTLEVNDRWGEALSYYEDALKEHRNNATLRERYDLSKLHYSLDRRYRDRSFRQSISSLSSQQSLSLLSELLQKTNTHYVNTPAWRNLGVRGTTAVEIALADHDFLKSNNLQVAPQQLASIRRQLYQLLSRQHIDNSRSLVAYVSEVARLLEARLRLRPTAAIMEFVSAAANGLDDYSAYLTSDQLREVYSQIEGNFVGLGVELKAEEGALLIVHVIPGSPAERAGIQAKDRIVAVDGKSTAEMSTDEAASMLTGAEGTWVRVTAYSPGTQPRVLNIRREHVEVPSLENVKIIEPDFGVAYIRIPTFQKSTARDLETALWDLHRRGMRSLILDLRGNPGGLLTASVEVADKFLTQGNIVSTRGRSAQEDFNYQAHYGGTWRVPLVVLIDGDSASASEIFAGAIKDNNRGRVIGAPSYGKGSVQGIFPLGYAGAGVRLTTAKFFSPSGVPISHRGVEPHDYVRSNSHTVAKPHTAGYTSAGSPPEDAILEAGIAAARSRIASPPVERNRQ